jgi:FtsH-binding integral membrane protein
LSKAKTREDDKKVHIGIATATLLFFFVVFGFSGIWALFTIVLMMFLPVYIVMRKMKIPEIEKVVFSFMMGVGFFPTFVYYIGVPIGSMRVSIAISFVLLMAIAYGISRKIEK